MDKQFLKEICRQEDELVEQLRVLREFKKTFFSPYPTTPIPSLASLEKPKPIPQSFGGAKKSAKKSYKKRAVLTIPAMVLNSLSEIDTGTTQDIANKMIQLYPSVSLEKALKDTKHHVSLLSKKGEINIIERRAGKLGFTYRSVDSIM